jgi:hypothetical protein
MPAMTLAVSPRAKRQRKCQRLRSTGSLVLRQRLPRSSMVRCGASAIRRAMSPFYNGATRHGITHRQHSRQKRSVRSVGTLAQPDIRSASRCSRRAMRARRSLSHGADAPHGRWSPRRVRCSRRPASAAWPWDPCAPPPIRESGRAAHEYCRGSGRRPRHNVPASERRE